MASMPRTETGAFAVRRSNALAEALASRVVGQEAAIGTIVPFVRMYQAGLSPEGRPAGVFLLLGPTGTGKTRTVEALAEVLHGSDRHLLRVDCGEYQMDHEVAKLIGAPPGYLGHRETQPVMTQQKLNAAATDRCSLSLVLFDEVEKAAPSLTRLLLGVLDRATLRLGDGNSVNFEHTMIFLTSNVGAREMERELRHGFGFAGCLPKSADLPPRIAGIGSSALRRAFPPEFINRVDAAITYLPLGEAQLAQILDQQLDLLQLHLERRLGRGAVRLEVSEESRRFLLRLGTSPEYGARELKRTILRHLTQPLSDLLADRLAGPGSTVQAVLVDGRLELQVEAHRQKRRQAAPQGCVEDAA